jgi:hypothetical protein
MITATANLSFTCAVSDLSEHDLHQWLQNAVSTAVDAFNDNYPRSVVDVRVGVKVPRYEVRLPLSWSP